MSLISEALRRVKEETERREAAERRIPLPPIRRPLRHRPGLVALVILSTIALSVSLVALYLQFRPELQGRTIPPSLQASLRETAPAVAPEPGSARAAQHVASSELETAATSAPPQETALGSERPAAAVELAAEPASPPPSTAAPVREQDAPVSEGLPMPAEQPSDPAVMATIPRESSDTSAESDPEATGTAQPTAPLSVYETRAQLPDGSRLELGGIAWSETAPVALLNGEAVTEGETVGGYLVVRIEPGRVELRDDTRTIVIRLK